MKLDPTKISQQIKNKYSINDNGKFKLAKIKNAELDKYDGEPKDKVEVEIGDTKQTDFYPQVKLMRWSNEVNFSIRLKEDDADKLKSATISTSADKILWEKGDIKIENYDFEENEGGYKFVWYLKKKPKTNKVEFTINTKGLDFFYQPPLTQEYQNGYSEEFQKEIVVTETQVKDLEGNVLVERPENVVGSYAVYHSTKGGMNDVYGKDYKVGKAFHIFRPHIIDANGLETWGILSIDKEAGTYSVEIPQEFLDRSSFPIRSNDTFGYSTEGGTGYNWSSRSSSSPYYNAARHGLTGSPSAGTVTQVDFYAYTDNASTINGTTMAFINSKDSGGSNIHNQLGTGEATISYSTVSAKKTISGLSISITAIDQIVNVSINPANLSSKKYIYAKYDLGGSTAHYFEQFTNNVAATAYSNSKESPWTIVSYNTMRVSIYATYTPGGGGTAYTFSGSDAGGIKLVSSIRGERVFWKIITNKDILTLVQSSTTKLVAGWKKSLTNALSLNETLSKLTKFGKLLSDVFSLTEALTVFKSGLRYTFSALETIYISVTQVAGHFTASLSEVLSLNQITYLAARFKKLFNEPIYLTEVLNKTKKTINYLTDTLAISDTLSKIQRIIKNVTDNFSLNEFIYLKSKFKKQLSDSITLVENFAKSGISYFTQSISEFINLNETISKLSQFKKTLTENISLNGLQSVIFTIKKSFTETIALVETFTVSSIGFIYSALESISLNSTLALSSLISFIVQITETIKLNDAIAFTIRIWTWLTKHASTWVYMAKSAIPTWLFTSKSTAPTWTHQSKSASPTWSYQSKSAEPTWSWQIKRK